MKTILQGEQYNLPFIIKQGNTTVTPEITTDIEMIIGSLRKTYANAGGIIYSSGKWLFPITQEESYKFPVLCPIDAQLRVKFNDGNIVGKKVPNIIIIESSTQEVL